MSNPRPIKEEELNAFTWNKIVKIEPHYERVYQSEDREEENSTMEITSIDLILENGERIRIDGYAYPKPEGSDEDILCTLRIRKAQWVDLKQPFKLGEK